MKVKTSQSLVKGAILLTIAGLLSKVLSATYRIPLQNLTGDLGFYIYQQVYPIIGTVMILSLYGFPAAVAKLTVERREQALALTWRTFYFPLLSVMFVINGFLFILLVLVTPYLVAWNGDTGLQTTYLLAACLFLFIPFLAFHRGLAQGNGHMHVTAYSQIAEQLVRVVIIVLAAYCVFLGRIAIEDIGRFGVFATMVGMTVTIILLSLFHMPKNDLSTTAPPPIPWSSYAYTMVSLGVIASLNHMILILIQLVDVITLVPQLMAYGWSPLQAMEQKGIFDRGQPLIQFGVVFGSSFALALIPTVVKKSSWSDETQVKAVREALLFSFYIAAGATLGLIILLRETNILLFQNDVGTASIQILVISMVLTSIIITATAILNSIGHIKQTALFILLALVVKWLLNILLVPYFGITGGALSTVGSLTLLMASVIGLLYKKLPYLRLLAHFHWRGFLLASMMMIMYLSICKFIFPVSPSISRVGLLLYVCFLVISGAIIYLACLIRYDVLSKSQYRALPFSRLFLALEKLVQKK